ncbi:hypothetical protein AB5J52_31315 [Streptomyces sp. R39]|uniref:Uncharacterized protein n=1 Tax=Streptomyces sp. R39 TaxID=3238631 RepID=A0AB39QVZ2_9ACTN|nr:hypothetical protein [Streptomyces shenzhenensis]
MDAQDQVCPVCGQPVERVVGRHKTLGAWVPVWGPGPCRNPDCAAYPGPGPQGPQETAPPRSPPPESAGGRPTP